MDHAYSVSLVAIEHFGVPKGTPMHENAPLNHSSAFTTGMFAAVFIHFLRLVTVPKSLR
jgi:hypothetical protein